MDYQTYGEQQIATQRIYDQGGCLRSHGSDECQCEACIKAEWYESQSEIESKIADEIASLFLAEDMEAAGVEK